MNRADKQEQMVLQCKHKDSKEGSSSAQRAQTMAIGCHKGAASIEAYGLSPWAGIQHQRAAAEPASISSAHHIMTYCCYALAVPCCACMAMKGRRQLIC